jgi:hypothetical protein
MSSPLPVVSTTIGAKGFDVIPGFNIIIAGGAEVFCQTVPAHFER